MVIVDMYVYLRISGRLDYVSGVIKDSTRVDPMVPHWATFTGSYLYFPDMWD